MTEVIGSIRVHADNCPGNCTSSSSRFRKFLKKMESSVNKVRFFLRCDYERCALSEMIVSSNLSMATLLVLLRCGYVVEICCVVATANSEACLKAAQPAKSLATTGA